MSVVICTRNMNSSYGVILPGSGCPKTSNVARNKPSRFAFAVGEIVTAAPAKNPTNSGGGVLVEDHDRAYAGDQYGGLSDTLLEVERRPPRVTRDVDGWSLPGALGARVGSFGILKKPK